MNHDYAIHIGYTLRYERLKSGLSLRALSEKVHLSHTMIANIEKAQMGFTAPLMKAIEIFLGYPLKPQLEAYKKMMEIEKEIFDHILYHDFVHLNDDLEGLHQMKHRAYQAGLGFYWAFLDFVIQVHDTDTVLNIPRDTVDHFAVMLDELTASTQLLLVLSLALYDRYHFHLVDAKKRVENLLLENINPHHKALVQDRLSDLYYHTFDRSKAIQYAQNATQTYQNFNNTNRAILSEIKKDLYGKRQHQSEERLPYEDYINQAQVYKLHEVIKDISYVWALRIFRFKKYAEAKRILETLDLSHPQTYHYYVIILYGSKDLKTLRHFLKHQPLKAPMITMFQPAINYVKAVLDDAEDAVLEQYLHQYLTHAAQQELYGESRWAESLFDDFYLTRRRYKEATLLKERLIKKILT